jgi:predicted regulator of Ras-like GTPase activity (Roadblock/LC7/MglB family)
MTTALHHNETLIARARVLIAELDSVCTSFLYAVVVTDDGFEVASVSGSDHERLASMVSSLQALAEGVAEELKIGKSEYVVLATEQGHVIQLRIPRQQLVLSAVFNQSETLGKVLSASKSTAEQIGAVAAAL